MNRRVLSAALTGLVLVAGAAAQTPACDALADVERRLAHKLLAEQYLYDCCDQTIAACLQDTLTCRLATRLADSICRRAAAGQDEAAIVRGLSRRARSMITPRTFAIDLDPAAAAVAGEDTARAVLVEYACARCPFCADITPRLYEEITAGRLKGRARMHLKIFPIRSHPHSKETGQGLMAAMALGRFWPFLLHTYTHFDEFSMDAQGAWAASAGMDPGTFECLVADPGTTDRLVESKKEGLRNGVNATPAFFINGRRYVGDLDLEEMVDVLLEEADRVAGLTRDRETGH